MPTQRKFKSPTERMKAHRVPLAEHSKLNPEPAGSAYDHQHDPTPGAIPGNDFQPPEGVGGSGTVMT